MLREGIWVLKVIGQLLLLWFIIAAWVVCIIPLSVVAGMIEERKK